MACAAGPVGKNAKRKPHIDLNREKEENMPIRQCIQKGDSLWSLAGRYLGSGTRYPQITAFHNQEAARHGLRHIDNENLIFVGETILIPPRQKFPEPGNGTKAAGDQLPIPLNLKVTYSIGRDTPPVIYVASYGEYSIKAEMTGKISIENKTPGHLKYVHNYELFMSKDPMQAKQKLYKDHDPALTAKPELVFESGRVKIKAPIEAKAHLGAHTIEVKAVTPVQMSGSLKPPTINGDLEMGRSRYGYSADIEYKVDVILHQRPRGGPEPVPVTEPTLQTHKLDEPPAHSSKWEQKVAEAGKVVAVVSVFLYALYRATELLGTRGMKPITIPPFIHEIDLRNEYSNNA
jgi:hypothetical protein